MQRLLDYMLHRADALKNLTCLTGVIATSELIRAFKPDLVVWSIGSEPFHPAIPGLQERLNAPNGRVTDVNGFLKNLDKEADITGKIDSVLNPSGGSITADSIGELIIQKDKVDPCKTRIICREGGCPCCACM